MWDYRGKALQLGGIAFLDGGIADSLAVLARNIAVVVRATPSTGWCSAASALYFLSEGKQFSFGTAWLYKLLGQNRKMGSTANAFGCNREN